MESIENYSFNNLLNIALTSKEEESFIAINQMADRLEGLTSVNDITGLIGIFKEAMKVPNNLQTQKSFEKLNSKEIQQKRIEKICHVIDETTLKLGNVALNHNTFQALVESLEDSLKYLVEEEEIDVSEEMEDIEEAIKNNDIKYVVKLCSQIIENHSEDILVEHINPFLLAIKSNNIELIKGLIEEGVNPNTPIDNPPINYALKEKKFDCVIELIKSGVDLNIVSTTNETPLALCFSCGDKAEELFSLMLKNGANVNTNFKQGRLIREKALEQKNPKFSEFVFKEHSYPQLMAIEGGRFILLAMVDKNEKLLDILLNDPYVNRNSDNGFDTPLTWAVEKREYPFVKLLLEKGCDPNASLKGKPSPLSMAVKNKDEAMVKLLFENGASPIKGSGPSISPIYYAHVFKRGDRQFYTEIIKLFGKSMGAKDHYKYEQLIKELGHAWELSNIAKIKQFEVKDESEINLIGMPPHASAGARMLKRTAKYLNEYLSSSEKILNEESLKSIVESFNESFQKKDEKEILQRINEGKLTIVSTGSKRHSTDIVFEDGYIVICDRGVAKGEKVVDYYKYDKEKIDVSILKEFMEFEHYDENEYHKMIKRNLSLLGCEGFPTKKFIEKNCILEYQTVGNCSFASAITALNVSLTLRQIKKSKVNLEHENSDKVVTPLTEAQNECLKILEFIQISTLHDYLKQTIEDSKFIPDHNILFNLFQKAWELSKNSSEFFKTNLIVLEKKYFSFLEKNNEKDLLQIFYEEKISRLSLIK